jgi:hypothetical protein
LIRYDPKEQDVEIKDGDNRGKTVVRYDVVREFVRLGPWRGSTATFKLPPPSQDGLVTLVLVQGARGGRIAAAAQRPAG